MPPRKKLRTDEVLHAIFHDSDSGSDSEYDSSEDYSSTDSENGTNNPPPPPVRAPGGPAGDNRGNRIQNVPVMNNDIVNDAAEPYNWELYEMEDPFYPEWLPAFRRRRGVLIDTDTFQPVDFFRLYFPDEAVQLIVDETNRYATQYLDAHVDLPPFSRLRKWENTTVEEISAMLAIQISFGICAKPSLAEYWNSFWLTKTDIPSIMSRNRYQILQTFLHFNDNTNRIERGQPGFNPLFKIQPLLDIVEPLYEQYFGPGRNLSVDESMVKFKGRIFFKQYMPAKPTKWGVKLFVLCDAKTGYALKHMVYTGKECFARDNNTPLSEQVVLKLLEGYEQSGSVVYCDNYYSSPQLFSELKRKKIGACGTVNPNRKHMPNELKPAQLRLAKGDDPVFYRADDLVSCCWHDTKRVTFLSTVDTNNTVDKRIRSRQAPGGYRTVEKPVLADRYNSYMAGVDLFDQMMGTYSYPHKCQKWYQPIFHYMRESALVNGYILYRESRQPDQRLLSPVDFRKEVIDGLLENFTSNSVKKLTAVANEFIRLKERHFPKKYDNPKYKPDCKVCGSLRPRVRRQTCYYCVDCDVALCIVPCFELFHTYKDYKSAREIV